MLKLFWGAFVFSICFRLFSLKWQRSRKTLMNLFAALCHCGYFFLVAALPRCVSAPLRLILLAGLADDFLNLHEHRRRVIRNAVFDSPFHAAFTVPLGIECGTDSCGK